MSRKSILVIEDDAGIRSSLSVLFETDGYSVILAENGQVALELLEKNSEPKPGLILLDLMMPVMDGKTFLLELQQKHPKNFADIPIFIMTAKIAASEITSKTTGFLKKPFDVNELLKVAKQYCD